MKNNSAYLEITGGRAGQRENFCPVKPGEVSLPGGESEAGRKIEHSIAYMEAHLDRPLQVAELAAMVNISLSHYFALFKQRTGCAPIDYFTRLRMRRACRLLDTTMSSVKEIADILGYSDPFYFSRVFKAVNHVAPSEYRLRQKKPEEEIKSRSIASGFVKMPGRRKLFQADCELASAGKNSR